MSNLTSKTTLAGGAFGIPTIVAELSNLMDSDPATVFEWQYFLTGLGILCIGILSASINKKG